MKRILLVDDHDIIRKGLKILLVENQLFTAVQIDEADTEENLVQLVKQNGYQIIVLDMRLPGIDFSKTMEWISTVSPASHILIFTDNPEEIYAMRCFQLGAKGFIGKTEHNPEICKAIEKVRNGEKYMSARFSELLIDTIKNPRHSKNPFDKLTTREMEIVSQLDNGKSLTDISKLLMLEYSTVSTYKRRIFEKLNIDSILSLSRLKQSFVQQHVNS